MTKQLKEILKLSVEERSHLVETIWDSIAMETAAAKVSNEHKVVVGKRLKEYTLNPSDVLSWGAVKVEIKKFSFIIVTSLFLFSCNTIKQSESKTDTADSSVTKQSTEVKTEMELFTNIEQIEYMESNNGVRAKHTF